MGEEQTKLLSILTEHYSENELKTLCFDLDIDYESLQDSGKANKARELIAYVYRCGRANDLIAAGKKVRPNALWPQAGSFEKPSPNIFRQQESSSLEASELEIVSCSSCGINFISGTNELLTHCSYCGTLLPSDRLRGEQLPPSLVAPFSVTREQMESKVLNWLVERKYTPADILKESRERFAFPVYLPYYLFDVYYVGHWSADIMETEKYTDAQGYSGTRTISKPSSGQVQSNSASLVVIATKRILSNEEIKFFEESAICKQEELGDVHIKKSILEPFSLLSDGLYKHNEHRVDEMVRKAAYEKASQKSSAGEPRRFDCQTIEKKCRSVKRVFLPYWIIQYKYREDKFRVLLDGQNPSRLTGESPEDKHRKAQIEHAKKPLRTGRALGLLVLTVIYVLCLLIADAPLLVTGIAIVLALLIMGITSLRMGAVESKLVKEAVSDRKRELEKQEQDGVLFFD